MEASKWRSIVEKMLYRQQDLNPDFSDAIDRYFWELADDDWECD